MELMVLFFKILVVLLLAEGFLFGFALLLLLVGMEKRQKEDEEGE